MITGAGAAIFATALSNAATRSRSGDKSTGGAAGASKAAAIVARAAARSGLLGMTGAFETGAATAAGAGAGVKRPAGATGAAIGAGGATAAGAAGAGAGSCVDIGATASPPANKIAAGAMSRARHISRHAAALKVEVSPKPLAAR
jgi:hypothetical protein